MIYSSTTTLWIRALLLHPQNKVSINIFLLFRQSEQSEMLMGKHWLATFLHGPFQDRLKLLRRSANTPGKQMPPRLATRFENDQTWLRIKINPAQSGIKRNKSDQEPRSHKHHCCYNHGLLSKGFFSVHTPCSGGYVINSVGRQREKLECSRVDC